MFFFLLTFGEDSLYDIGVKKLVACFENLGKTGDNHNERGIEKVYGIIVTPEEAQKEMDIFFGQHPKLKTFSKKQEKFLRKNGYLVSLFGRKRRLPQIYSSDKGEEAYALRLALNFPCLLPSSQALSKTKGPFFKTASKPLV